MKKNLILTALFALSVLLLNGCKEKEPTFDNLSLNPTTLSMKVGESVSVTIPTGSGEYTAASNNESVATALLSGKTLTVTAKAKGDAAITVTDKMTKQTAQVTVTVTLPKIILTTKKAIGEQIGLTINVANESDKADCWIDLNNNGIKEEGDTIKSFGNATYPLGAQTITIHGKVTGLWCPYDLTALDVTKNTALTTLNCFGNQLTALDVTNNTALTELNCSSNQLTALDVSKNTVLTELHCNKNQLNQEAVIKLFSELPNRQGVAEGILLLIWNPDQNYPPTDPEKKVATDKNWMVIER